MTTARGVEAVDQAKPHRVKISWLLQAPVDGVDLKLGDCMGITWGPYGDPSIESVWGCTGAMYFKVLSGALWPDLT